MESNFNPYMYIYTVLQYAKVDLSFQNALFDKRSPFPLSEDEKKHFSDMLYHIDRAMTVLDYLQEDDNNKSSLPVDVEKKSFLTKVKSFFGKR